MEAKVPYESILEAEVPYEDVAVDGIPEDAVETVTLPEAEYETVALLGHADDPEVVPEVEGDTVAVSVNYILYLL